MPETLLVTLLVKPLLLDSQPRNAIESDYSEQDRISQKSQPEEPMEISLSMLTEPSLPLVVSPSQLLPLMVSLVTESSLEVLSQPELEEMLSLMVDLENLSAKLEPLLPDLVKVDLTSVLVSEQPSALMLSMVSEQSDQSLKREPKSPHANFTEDSSDSQMEHSLTNVLVDVSLDLAATESSRDTTHGEHNKPSVYVAVATRTSVFYFISHKSLCINLSALVPTIKN